MIITNEEKVIRSVIIQCRCDKCNAAFIPENIPHEHFSQKAIDDANYLSGTLIRTTTGYHSKADMTTIEISLCENCLIDLQESFKS